VTGLSPVSGAAPARVEGFEVGYMGGDGVERRVPLARAAGVRVEKPEDGPTQRKDVTVLHKLLAKDADELGDPDECGMSMGAYPPDDALDTLTGDRRQ
jgi:hypothetical protein